MVRVCYATFACVKTKTARKKPKYTEARSMAPRCSLRAGLQRADETNQCLKHKKRHGPPHRQEQSGMDLAWGPVTGMAADSSIFIKGKGWWQISGENGEHLQAPALQGINSPSRYEEYIFSFSCFS
jgi:hypothetical protein